MGRGSRHSKNAGGMGSEGLNYHERRAMHFGTQNERLGKVRTRRHLLWGIGPCVRSLRKMGVLDVGGQDSLRAFDHCGLTLSPAIDPVVTPDGIVYSKEVILENLLKQKKAIARELKAWEEQEKERSKEVRP